MTQGELSELMVERGFPFHQQTVQKIEGGTRSVKIEEAVAFAEIFECSLDDLFGSEGRHWWKRTVKSVEDMEAQLRRIAVELPAAQWALVAEADEDPVQGVEYSVMPNLTPMLETIVLAEAEAEARGEVGLLTFRRLAERFPKHYSERGNFKKLKQLPNGPASREWQERLDGWKITEVGKDGQPDEAS